MAYNYYPNNQFYMQDLQNMKDRIDNQMRQLQNQQNQQPIPQPQIHQSFQLAPQSSFSEIQAKYVSDINDVKNTFVMSLGMFLNKELNTLWIKNTNGDIRTFELNELVEIDPKDREIAMLKQEIEKMKEMVSNESNGNNTDNDEPNESKNATKLSNNKRTNAK